MELAVMANSLVSEGTSVKKGPMDLSRTKNYTKPPYNKVKNITSLLDPDKSFKWGATTYAIPPTENSAFS